LFDDARIAKPDMEQAYKMWTPASDAFS
jgi:hypothetical protein